MISKALLIGVIVGGVTYAFVKAHRQAVRERTLEREDQLRWENEGGASARGEPQLNMPR